MTSSGDVSTAETPSLPAGHPGAIRLRLPATSANLGSGFDAVGLALSLTLTIDATPRLGPGAPLLKIEATGRNADRCSRPVNNLIFETYREVLTSAGRSITPLHLKIRNEIPLGMGCGSSAAALLGGVMLANHFGQLGWPTSACLEEAARREGHPDNVAACALGYLTVSAVSDGTVAAATCGQDVPWKLLLALPEGSLATERARALLPATYLRSDAVNNVQRAALLVAAFAQSRGDLLHVAMQDRMHQPYRMQACPLLPKLLPLSGHHGILGVSLSGAGPGVLLIADQQADVPELFRRIRAAVADPELELIETTIAGQAHCVPQTNEN